MQKRPLTRVFLLMITAVAAAKSKLTGAKDRIPEYSNVIGGNISANVRESCGKGHIIPENRVDTSDRLRRLRLRMKASSYDAYIIPTNDEHQSEYVADHDKRRQFISGFSGSAGTAVVLQDQAALWTDGRYFLQAEQELDCNWLLMKQYKKGVPSVSEWLIQNLGSGAHIGADPKLLPYIEWLTLKEKLEAVEMNLVADNSNLIDDIWSLPQGRAPESVDHIFIHDMKYAGKSWQEKILELREMLRKKEVNGTIVTALDEISWLFNLRGMEVPHNPVFKAYAFVSEIQIRLYIKSLKLTDEVRKHLHSKDCTSSSCVQVVDYSETFNDISELVKSSGKILMAAYSSYAVTNLIPKEKRRIEKGPSPVSVLRAVKNSVEIQGMKNANVKDAVAVVDFIARLDKEISEGVQWDELKAARVLSKFRSEQDLYKGDSFSAISASGPNAAIIHYSPSLATNRSIDKDHIYLLDSGGQYLDGTTDTTRTFHFGQPTDFQKEAYTRVLMGAINLMSAVFPEGVRDMDLDIVARQPLYKIGLDYMHGTSHGIGSFLSVHEAPIRIGNPAHGNAKGFALKPGMFMSDEPGYYKDGEFGIRLETVMMVVKANVPYRFNNIDYYTFEPVSLVPFEPKLINYVLLTKKQKEWLNRYNGKVRNSVGVELRRQRRETGFQYLLSKTEFIALDDCISDGTMHSFDSQLILLLLMFLYLLC